ncbi:hypothetical protein OFO01_01030 [Campylobacter sp. JMF_01 NE2]|uniref:hypothetical protein n=1 Tax=unclassified Campylobacter TaxID=2593542 RepID=UPI0022EA0360|nr:MULTISPECIES: hypothetical protein [unclassified Campylobacter]MDA3052039.1 hypothetical protein [Campylobacter sp. JMF_03 NE3]MDA3066373.1 hypothetical protein [Campylobacter sp. JMF_01 NE2]
MNLGRNLLATDSLPFEDDDEIYKKASRIFTEISYDEIMRDSKNLYRLKISEFVVQYSHKPS